MTRQRMSNEANKGRLALFLMLSPYCPLTMEDSRALYNESIEDRDPDFDAWATLDIDEKFRVHRSHVIEYVENLWNDLGCSIFEPIDGDNDYYEDLWLNGGIVRLREILQENAPQTVVNNY